MTTAPSPDRLTRREAAERVGGLFARHGRTVYGICRTMLRDVEEAEDAAQQVFLSAHKALLAGSTVRDAGGWLATIARNECRARIAAGMRRPLPLTDEDLDALPASGDEQLRRSQLDEIRGALAELPERQREAVVLRYLYGLRYGEVATALGLSRPATEALLFRARRALRVSLRPVAVVLVVPAVVREELALALPGFEAKSASAAAGAGVAGGLLAKLTAGSAGVKVATAAVAVTTASAVGSVNFDRPTTRGQETIRIAQPAEPGASRSHAGDDSPGSSGLTSGPQGADDSSGPGDSADDADRADGSDERRGRTGSSSNRVKAGDESGSSGPEVESDDPTTGGDDEGSGDPGPEETDDDRSGSSGSGSGSSGSSSSGSSGSGSDSSGSGSSGSGSDSGSHDDTTTDSDPEDDERDDD